MKTFTRVIAVIMMVAVLASLMVACGEKKAESTEEVHHPDNNLVGTWKQTDETDGNWTWTFNSDGTCSLKGDDGSESTGTYLIPEEDNGKIKITLDKWEKPVMFTYSVTTKVLDLESFTESYYCEKQ